MDRPASREYFVKKSVPCAGARVNRAWKRPIQRRSLGNSHRAGRRVRGKGGPDFSRSGPIARPPCVLPGQAAFRICMLKNYTERNGTQDVSGLEGKMRGQSGRWGSSSACFCFYRAILISVLRRNALRDGLLCLLFMGNNTFIKQVFNRHSKRMSNGFQCFQAHFPDSAAPGAGV